MKEACFSVVRTWARMRVMEGCGIGREKRSQELLMQEDVPGCEGPVRSVLPLEVTGQHQERGWESPSAKGPHRPHPGEGLG